MKTLLILLSLILVAGHIWLSMQLHDGPNELILAEAVQPQNGDDVSIRYSYLDGILEGTVDSEEASHAAEMSARNQRTVGRIINNLEVVAPAIEKKPAAFFARLDSDKMTLRGLVPNQDYSDSLESAANALGHSQVTNELLVDSTTEDPAWIGDMPNLLGNFFDGAESGEIDAAKGKLRLKRGMRKMANRQRVKDSIAHWDLSLVDEISMIRDRPARLYAALEDNTLTLRGLVPSEAIKSDLEEEAQSSGHHVVNELEVQEDVSKPRWEGRANGFMGDFFKGASKGELEIGKNVRLRRQFDKMGAKTAWADRAKALIPGANIENQLSVVKPKPKTKPNQPSEIIAVLTDKTLKITGQVPTTEFKTALTSAVANRNPDIEIRNNLDVAPKKVSIPAWADEIAPVFGEFFASSASDAEWEISPDLLRLQQILPDEAAKRSWGSKAKSLLSTKGDYIDQLSIAKLPPSRPATILAVLDQESLKITGQVPSNELKDALSRSIASRYLGYDISNDLKVIPAKVLVPDWADSVAPVFGEFFASKPKKAEFEISPRRLRMQQTLANKAAKKEWVAKAKALMPSSGQFIDQLAVTPPPAPTKPANVLAVLDNKTITLTGKVPSDKLKTALGKAAVRSHPKAKVVNNLVVDQEKIIKPEWSETVSPMLYDFLSSKPGVAEFEITPKQLRLKREVANKATKATWVTKAKTLMPGENRFVDQLSVAPAPKPTAKPEYKTLENYTVYFDTGADWTNWNGQVELQKAAVALSELDKSNSILVKGFADAQGDPVANQALSERRAKWVINYLVGQGVAKERIKLLAVGASESKEARWKDRRVEVTIIK